MGSNFNGHSGYTVAELVVSLSVVAIMAAIAVPNFLEYLPTHRLNGASRQLYSDVLWARSRAVADRNNYNITFISVTQYRLHDDDDNDGTLDGGEWSLIKSIEASFPSITLNSTADTVISPRGTAIPFTVSVSGAAGTRQVIVELTGAARIE